MKKSLALHIISLIIFGLNGVVISFISLDSYQIVLLRTLLGSVFLITLFLLTRNKFTFFRHKKALLFLALSGISMGISWMFLYRAFLLIGVGVSSLTYCLGPVIVVILSPIIFKERLTLFKIIGFVTVLTGVVMINANFSQANFNLFGLVCALLSALTYAFLIVFSKKSKEIGGLENSTLQLVFAFLTVGICVGIKQGYAMEITAKQILPILFLGLISTGFGCYLYFSSLQNLPASTVSVCSYIEPLCAVIFSVTILGEKMSVLQIIGAVLIIGGALVAECLSIKKQKRNENLN